MTAAAFQSLGILDDTKERLNFLSGPRSDRICAEDLGTALGPPWLGTEATDHQHTVSRHLTSDCSSVRPSAADCSSALANSLTYMLMSVGLKLHPYLTPHLLCTWILWCRMFFPQHRFPSICIADPHAKLSQQTFLISKHEKTLLLIWFVCLSNRVSRVNTWSVIR
jgi:hypothetical protein